MAFEQCDNGVDDTDNNSDSGPSSSLVGSSSMSSSSPAKSLVLNRSLDKSALKLRYSAPGSSSSPDKPSVGPSNSLVLKSAISVLLSHHVLKEMLSLHVFEL